MITVIATGFDGKQRRQTNRLETQAPVESSNTIRAPRERDFLEELQRQRDESADGLNGLAGRRDEEAAAVAAPRFDRSVGDVAATKRSSYDADDLEIPSFLRRK